MSALMRSGSLKPAGCDAPGRLDFLGGVADYSGSLVLEMPTQVRTTVTLTPEKSKEASFASPAFGVAAFDLAPLRELVGRDAAPAEFRAHLDETKFPQWARYPLGCFIILVRHARWFPDSGFLLQISSTVPDGQGVSSSAALEIATLRTLNQAASLGLSATELARLGQQAENLIVGASCGLMDQLASSCGRPGELLPILCRPDTLFDPLPLPKGLIIAGWPSGVKHRVGASPYATARAAAFMGKRILEMLSGRHWNHTSEIPLADFLRFESGLPAGMTGMEFLSGYKDTEDPLTRLDPDHSYPVRAATRFPIEENARAHRAREILSNYAADPIFFARELRAILKASHDGYGAMGLGSTETDAFLEHLLNNPTESGLIGGRISGGGSGGTVVVLLEKAAKQRLQSMALSHRGGSIIS
jgi:galactokinase